METPRNDNIELKRTEWLGWISVGVAGGALIPAALAAAGIAHPYSDVAVILVLGIGLLGLMAWYLRVRSAVRRLNEILAELEHHAGEQDGRLRNLEELEKIKKTSMQMASHQLRAPLAAMQSCLRVLLNDDDIDPADSKKLLNDAQARGEDMLELVNDILGLAESESVVRLETDMEPEEIDVEQAVRDIVNFFAARAAEKNVRFVININEPPGAVRANRKLFNQVVLNLVSNAFRYSDMDRDVVITLGVTAGDRPTLTVQNWGLLISEQDFDNIFKEFWRSNDARKYVGRGTGLGLSIVKNIIDYRGGNIRVSSDSVNGTRFIVEIPRRRKGGTQNGKGKEKDSHHRG